MLAKDIWDRDKHKFDDLVMAGYDVLVINEREYHEDKTLIVKRCKEFLSETKNTNW